MVPFNLCRFALLFGDSCYHRHIYWFVCADPVIQYIFLVFGLQCIFSQQHHIFKSSSSCNSVCYNQSSVFCLSLDIYVLSTYYIRINMLTVYCRSGVLCSSDNTNTAWLPHHRQCAPPLQWSTYAYLTMHCQRHLYTGNTCLVWL